MAYELDLLMQAAPWSPTDGFRRLTTSAADATITPAAGRYEIVNDSSVSLSLRWGATAVAGSLPASGDAEVVGRFVLPAGASMPLLAPTGTDVLHAALISAGAGELWLRRVVT